MVAYGPWQQRDDYETPVGERLPGRNMTETWRTDMGEDRNRPWDDELNDGVGTAEHKPPGIQNPLLFGMDVSLTAGGSVHIGDSADENWIEYMDALADADGERFAVAHDYPEGEGTDFDLRGPLTISPFDWAEGAIGYEWEDGEGMSTVVGARWVLRMTDHILRGDFEFGPDDSTPSMVRIYVNGALGERQIAFWVVAAHNVVHEFEFDLTEDMADELGTIDVYPSIQKVADWFLIDPMTAGAPDWPTVISGPSDVSDDLLFYMLRPPRHRFIYDVATPAPPWRLWPRDDDLRNSPRIFPRPTTRQRSDRISGDW